MAGHKCSGSHHWYPVENGTSHNLRVVNCGDYVLALEQLIRELGSDPELAMQVCMDGASGKNPTPTSEPRKVLPNTVTWAEVVEQTCDKLNPYEGTIHD